MNRRYWIRTAAVAALMLLACGGMLMAGASREAKAAKPVKIGFLVKLAECSWFQDEWKFARQAGAECGFELIEINVPDGEKVLTAIDNLAAQGAQGFIICTPDVKLGPSIKMKADQYGMKLMSVDDRFIGADGKPMEEVHHMGISAYEIGRLVGKALLEEAKKRGWDLSKTGADCLTYDELPTSKERTDGASDMLAEMGFPKQNIFRTPTATDSTTEGGFDATNIVVAAHPEIKTWLVYSLCDDTTIGGIRALEGHGFSAQNTIGVGINGNDLAIGEFEKKEMTGFVSTVLLAAKRHGYETSVNMYKWITENKEPPKVIFTAGFLMDRTNYHQVRKEVGLE
jgi:L-arabinose transport system substrate-binding protein